MDSLKIYEEACDVVDTLLRQGKTAEEIYAEYRNKLSEEYEKMNASSDVKICCKDRLLYSEVTRIAADCLAKEAVRKAGYQMMERKRFIFWVKTKRIKGVENNE